MSENSSDRIARAAGRAARAFRENQSADRVERERRAPAADRPGLKDRAARAVERTAPVRERVGHAAGEAGRTFKEGQARDAERLAEVRTRVRDEDEAQRAQRRASRERALGKRDEAEAGRVHPLLRLTRLWWLAVSLLLAALGGAFVFNGRRAEASGGEVVDPLTGLQSVGPLGGATGQYTLGGALIALALITLWGWIGLLRRRRSAISTLTTIAVVLAIPAATRPNVLFLVLGLVMAIGAVLLWLPPVRTRVRR